jgi:hypothetical protein
VNLWSNVTPNSLNILIRPVNMDGNVPGLGLGAANHHLGLGTVQGKAVVPGELGHGIH